MHNTAEHRHRTPHQQNPNPDQMYQSTAQAVAQTQSYQPYAYGAPPVDLNNPMIQMAAASGAQFFDSGHRMIQSNVLDFFLLQTRPYMFLMYKLPITGATIRFSRNSSLLLQCRYELCREKARSSFVAISSQGFLRDTFASYLTQCCG